MDNGQHLRVIALIPAFNESAKVGAVVAEAKRFVEKVLVIDDGSSDDSGDAARKAGADVLRNEKNIGKGATLRRGFTAAVSEKFDAVVTLDADGQHDPAEMPKLLAALENSADFVIGCRMNRTEKMPLLRRLANRSMSWGVSKLAGQRIKDSQSGYRAIRRCVLETVELSTSGFDLESEILIRAGQFGFRIAEVDIQTIYNDAASKIHPGRDTVRFLKLIARETFPAWTKKRP